MHNAYARIVFEAHKSETEVDVLGDTNIPKDTDVSKDTDAAEDSDITTDADVTLTVTKCFLLTYRCQPIHDTPSCYFESKQYARTELLRE